MLAVLQCLLLLLLGLFFLKDAVGQIHRVDIELEKDLISLTRLYDNLVFRVSTNIATYTLPNLHAVAEVWVQL